MTTFASTFRELVTPDLRRLCEQEAVPVAWETKDFTAAWAVVMREAKRRGLLHLPQHLQDELDWWVCRTICAEVAKHMPAVMADHNPAAVTADYLEWCWAGDDLAADFLDAAIGALG